MEFTFFPQGLTDPSSEPPDFAPLGVPSAPRPRFARGSAGIAERTENRNRAKAKTYHPTRRGLNTRNEFRTGLYIAAEARPTPSRCVCSRARSPYVVLRHVGVHHDVTPNSWGRVNRQITAQSLHECPTTRTTRPCWFVTPQRKMLRRVWSQTVARLHVGFQRPTVCNGCFMYNNEAQPLTWARRTPVRLRR